MAFVVTENSTIACNSNGTVTPTGQSKLKVSGGAVVRLDGINGKTVSGCGVQTNPNTGTKQCQTVASASGVASKLKVAGAPVALDTLSGSTDGMHPPSPPATSPSTAAISVTVVNQSKLKAS
jgi:hypothetical protein